MFFPRKENIFYSKISIVLFEISIENPFNLIHFNSVCFYFLMHGHGYYLKIALLILVFDFSLPWSYY